MHLNKTQSHVPTHTHARTHIRTHIHARAHSQTPPPPHTHTERDGVRHTANVQASQGLLTFSSTYGVMVEQNSLHVLNIQINVVRIAAFDVYHVRNQFFCDAVCTAKLEFIAARHKQPRQHSCHQSERGIQTTPADKVGVVRLRPQRRRRRHFHTSMAPREAINDCLSARRGLRAMRLDVAKDALHYRNLLIGTSPCNAALTTAKYSADPWSGARPSCTGTVVSTGPRGPTRTQF